VRETVLVTGASSGFGREFARLFAADGSALVLVARRRERLEELALELRARYGTSVRILPEDLADPEAPQRLFEALRDEPVDVLVNNAGFGARGDLARLPLTRQEEMIEVNVAAVTRLARLFLPGMLARRRGGILNVASTAGFQPGPHMAVYYATKAYVLSFSEALSEEVRGTGLCVTCLAPGPAETGFAAEADMRGTLLFRLGAMSAARVARAGYRGFRAGRALVVPGVSNKLAAASLRISPRSLVTRLVGKLNEKAGDQA
jgi:short-subunit dehydrogenase